MRKIIVCLLLVICSLSFLMTLWWFFFHPSHYGLVSGFICGTSFILSLILGSPDDEGDSIIDHGRNLG